LLDRWCASKEVADDFQKLRQLVPVEEFKACVPANIKTCIDEQKATTLHQAAVLASLTHRSAFPPTVGSGNGNDKSGTLPIPPKGRHRYRHEDGRHNNVRSFNKSSGVVCNYCMKRGHVMLQCWSLQKKKSDALVRAVSNPRELFLADLCYAVIDYRGGLTPD